MPRIHLIAVGRLKSGPFRDAFDDYLKRLQWDLSIQEIDIRNGGPKQQQLENDAILAAVRPKTPIIVLDERGKTMTSPQFAQTLSTQFDQGQNEIQFIIGGADGLLDPIRSQARTILSFGQFTWPHMMVRVMLIEQLYRAQQIIAGHPYHRGD